MSKYIIKNCANCYFYEDDDLDYWCEFQRDNTVFANPCANSSCLLKQIVEKCKEMDKYYSECIEQNRKTYGKYMDAEDMTWLMGRAYQSYKILDLLQIEEIESEDKQN